ncbi:MAG: extracellular solute-binding protein [Nonomuraea sp.]|nr:extracellular solute-binding protein [Nonomuraea sp.]
MKLHVYGAALATALALTACGSGSGGGEPADGKTKIVFSYWGSDSRQKLTEQAIKKFEEKNPTITVEGDFSDWDSYYEKLATKVAADDAPDVMSIEIRGLAEYAGRGALADLSGGKINVADLDQQVITAGQVDGKQYAIPSGVNTFAMIANKATIEAAGQKLPDDKTWTWDDYVSLAQKISEKNAGKIYGTEYNYNPAFLQIFAAQRGEKLYDGAKIGVTADTLKAWWALLQKLVDTKAGPVPAKMSEATTKPDLSLLATNTGAMGTWWSNQLGTLSKSSGQELTVIRTPKAQGAASSGMFLQPAMYYTASAKSEHAAEADKFIDFLVNDPDAAAILLSDRGLPTNAKVLAAVKDKLPPTDQKTLAFIDEVRADLTPVQVPPKGAMQMEDIFKRNSEEVLFGKATPDAGAQKLLSEANAALAG